MSRRIPPQLNAVLETGLYVDDIRRARTFYEGVLGLEPMFSDERLTAYPVGPSVLLLFTRGTTEEPARMPHGTIPGHDGQGRLHFAFAVAEETIEPWREQLQQHDITIEGEVHWPQGGRSLYFRDPDGHLLEVVSPGLWANYRK